PTASASATTRQAAMVVRTRMVPSRRNRPLAPIGIESVPDESDGLDGSAGERHVDLLAQVADVDLHDVRVTTEGVVPDMVENLGLGDHVAGTPHEELEQ